MIAVFYTISAKKTSLNRMMEMIKESVGEEKQLKFLMTFHIVKGKDKSKVNHHYVTRDFPTADLMKCVAYLEDEFVKILKRGSTGEGRM